MTTATITPRSRAASNRQVLIGDVWIDAVRRHEALASVASLVARGEGGSVFTPNVDHVVMAAEDARFRSAYARASLVLADGMPVLWASHVLGTPLPEKVSGSDLVEPLARLAASSGWRVYLVGGAPGVADAAGARLRSEFDVNVVGCDAPRVAPDGTSSDEREVLARIRTARPDLVLVALGAPKQEFWIEGARAALGSAVAVTVGASLSFLTGHARRAPRWISGLGLEWLYRLAQEPRRLWRRYLVRDPGFVLIVGRTFRLHRRFRSRLRPVSLGCE